MNVEFRVRKDGSEVSYSGDNKLYKEVVLMVNNQINPGYTVIDYLNDVQQGGCQSGIEGGLIYYTDTVKFYKKYSREINSLLAELISEFGSIQEMFGDKWDNDDPLARGELNQNLLAWFAYEEICNNILQTLED